MLLFLIFIFLLPTVEGLNFTLYGLVSCEYGKPYNFSMEILDIGFWKNTIMDTQSFMVIQDSKNSGYFFNVLFEKGFFSISKEFSPALRISHTCSEDEDEIETMIYLKNEYSKLMKTALVTLHLDLPEIADQTEKTTFTLLNHDDIRRSMFDIFSGGPYDSSSEAMTKLRLQSMGRMGMR